MLSLLKELVASARGIRLREDRGVWLIWTGSRHQVYLVDWNQAGKKALAK